MSCLALRLLNVARARSDRFASKSSRVALRCGVLVVAATTLGGCRKPAETSVADANRLFLEGQKFAAAGETDKAIDALSKSIAANPAVYAYLERAKLLAKTGRDAEAQKDCEAAFALTPDNPDPTALWLQAELKKPAAERFQGKFKEPPNLSGR